MSDVNSLPEPEEDESRGKGEEQVGDAELPSQGCVGDPAAARAPTPPNLRRVALAVVVISVLHGALVFLVFPLLSSGDMALKVILGLIPYVLGGVILKQISSKTSSLDLFYGAVGPASCFPLTVELQRVAATNPANVAEAMERTQWLAVLIPVLGSVLVTLFGGWLSEKIPSRALTER